MKVNVVVVTYNRLQLLKECLVALQCQTYPLNKVIVVDNCSTDETPAFLNTFSDNDLFHIIRTAENIGGAGGFSLGLKTSVETGGDYTWLMDDDTVPEVTALEELIKVGESHPDVGFVCSRVNWTDGSQHVMNRAVLLDNKGNILQPSTGEEQPVQSCLLCSFVSVLISTKAVYRVGLPIKEFFIWCDDIEYTLRIHHAGFPCFYAGRSVVWHKTATNYSPTISEVPASMAWRFYYQARNRCYMKHRQAGNKWIFYLSIWNMYRVYKHRINKRTDGNKKIFLEAVRKGCKDGLTFFPAIEYVAPREDR